MGSAAVVDVSGDLTERTADRLEHARRRATNGLTAFRLAAFCTGDHETGQYHIQRIGEHAFSVDVPEHTSPWDVLRFAELLSIGPLEAERHTGAIVVHDTRWTTTDGASDEEVVADGGSEIQTVDGSMQTLTPSPFAVAEDDEPRTERAKTEDMDVFLHKAPGRYEVHSASGNYYEVDVLEATCSCPDRAERCKHLRRVDIEITAKLVPRPDGRLP
jgi:hypothetical protein